MSPTTVLRFNFAVPGGDPTAFARAYRAGVEMARYAEEHGLDLVSFEEHHASDDGWSPAPLTTAGAVLGATERLRVVVQAALLPLHDPVRLLEQLAVLDLLSDGRLTVVLGLGYRPEEYAAAGVDWEGRGAVMDAHLDAILAGWSGAPFAHDGRQVVVTPSPRTPAARMLSVGGSSRPAARRAARHGLPLTLPADLPEIADYYRDRCAAAGTTPVVTAPGDTSMVVLAEDPERGWSELGPHLLHEARRYQGWQRGSSSAVRSAATTVDQLRAEGVYQVLSPDQLVERCRARPDAAVVLHPLCGGIPVEAGWTTLRLYVEQVLPRVGAVG